MIARMAPNDTLEEADLRRLDTKLDSEVASLALLSQQRAASLMAILNAFEDFVDGQPRDNRLAEHAAVHAIDGLNVAAAWCLQHCPSGANSFQYAPSLSLKASECLRSAMEYSKVFDMMSLLWRKVVVGVAEAPDAVRVRLKDADSQRVLIAGRITDSANSSETRGAIQAAQMPALQFGCLARPRKTGHSRMAYDIPLGIYREFASQQERVLQNTWELDDRWELGGYTVGEFREFWLTLTTLSWIHIYACSAFGHDEVRDSLILYASRKRWCHRISYFSGLPDVIVEAIMADFEFRASTTTSIGAPEFNCQPFVELSAGILGLSGWLVVLTNGEEALWHVISLLRPHIHATVRNLKERYWISSLQLALKEYGLDTFPRLPFTHDGKNGDLDLLIIDRDRGFGVASQLKWLKPPEHVKDRFYNDEELAIGIQQAEHSHAWVESEREEVASRTGLDASLVKRIQFKPLVLSKNTLGSGWLKQTVPVFNERLLHSILGNPHRKDLRAAYLVAEEKRYLPISGVHFQWEPLRARFGGIAFTGEGLGVRLLRHWNPATDIDLSRLDSML